MNEIGQSQVDVQGTEPSYSSEPPRKISRLLLLWPLAGIVGLLYGMIRYQPVDDKLIYWIGAAPCMIIFMFVNVAWRSAQRGKGMPSFLPRTLWLASVCLAVPIVLLVNGALDYSPVEKHRQIITRTIFEHGRRDSTFYYVECSSWRGRSYEKLKVSPREYLESRPGDSFIVETHKGALGIPLLVSAHRTD